MATGHILQADEGERIHVVGDALRVLVDSTISDGLFAAFEDETQPGCGPPLHRHDRDDEFFYVLDGTVKFQIDGKESIVTRGGSAFSPRGSIHSFMNIGDKPLRMLIVTTPGGLETPFRETDKLQRQGAVTPQMLSAVFAKFDLTFHGPPLTHCSRADEVR